MEGQEVTPATAERGLEEVRDDIRTLRREVAALGERIKRLEVRGELVDAPGAAGDEHVTL